MITIAMIIYVVGLLGSLLFAKSMFSEDIRYRHRVEP